MRVLSSLLRTWMKRLPGTRHIGVSSFIFFYGECGLDMAEKSLEDLLLETEQKILNNEFYKRYIVTYDDEDYEFYIKPLNQGEFIKLYIKYGKSDILELSKHMVYACIIHGDGTPYKEELINILFDIMPAGVATEVLMSVYEMSGIETPDMPLEDLQRFLEGAFEL